jgi:hypothetical protein
LPSWKKSEQRDYTLFVPLLFDNFFVPDYFVKCESINQNQTNRVCGRRGGAAGALRPQPIQVVSGRLLRRSSSPRDQSERQPQRPHQGLFSAFNAAFGRKELAVPRCVERERVRVVMCRWRNFVCGHRRKREGCSCSCRCSFYIFEKQIFTML